MSNINGHRCMGRHQVAWSSMEIPWEVAPKYSMQGLCYNQSNHLFQVEALRCPPLTIQFRGGQHEFRLEMRKPQHITITASRYPRPELMADLSSNSRLQIWSQPAAAAKAQEHRYSYSQRRFNRHGRPRLRMPLVGPCGALWSVPEKDPRRKGSARLGFLAGACSCEGTCTSAASHHGETNQPLM